MRRKSTDSSALAGRCQTDPKARAFPGPARRGPESTRTEREDAAARAPFHLPTAGRAAPSPSRPGDPHGPRVPLLRNLGCAPLGFPGFLLSWLRGCKAVSPFRARGRAGESERRPARCSRAETRGLRALRSLRPRLGSAEGRQRSRLWSSQSFFSLGKVWRKDCPRSFSNRSVNTTSGRFQRRAWSAPLWKEMSTAIASLQILASP
ncbi:uncharacterized protein LOC130542662 isoform X2 [Ursus arctos]|uniref:uncharacterized protein LOC130542662 isoform X2 n=1 Tax=Ursus arctos TaxID=9644 RepID=UPI002548983C|nr:uncharacterized protein LOC130542662 isoform X2 [Ursus arctos]